MTDFLETPVGDFQWGPENRHWAYLRHLLPALTIGAGLTFIVVGLIWLVPA